VVWAFVLYTSFRTPQTNIKYAITAYLFTAIIGMTVFSWIYPFAWINQWFQRNWLFVVQDGKMVPRADVPIYQTLLAFVFGVGVHEEFTKAMIIFFLAKRPGKLAMPQTIVFYGLLSGLAFGIREGNEYIIKYLGNAITVILKIFHDVQADKFNTLTEVKIQIASVLGSNFMLNLLRLSSLPLFHAAWAGISSYFIAFAALNPRRRWGLWILAILVPAVIHGVYDSFIESQYSWIAIAMAVLTFVLLAVYLRSAGNVQKQLVGAPRPPAPAPPPAGAWVHP
jgi:RsiW-degrading membrane proteinase PrsW (M82 family)